MPSNWTKYLVPLRKHEITYNDLPVYMEDRILPPLSTIDGKTVQVDELIGKLIEYYYPNIESIYDPTCGTENHMFSSRLEDTGEGWCYKLPVSGRCVKYIASDVRSTKWNCYNGRCLKWNVLREDPPGVTADVVVYDPPYVPHSMERRGTDYGVDVDRDVASVRLYYRGDVLRKMAHVSRLGVVIKGSDFYYPLDSDYFHGFLMDILTRGSLRDAGLRVVAVHVYRYYNTAVPLYRHRVSRSMQVKLYRRTIVNHTYFVFTRKMPG